MHSTQRTGAPVPLWLRYYDGDIRTLSRFGVLGTDPAAVEQFFQHRLRRTTIREDYIQEIEVSLRQLDDFIQMIGRYDRPSHPTTILTDLAYGVVYGCNDKHLTQYGGDRPYILFDGILIRPCGEKLGLFSLYLWYILQSCMRNKCDLHIENMTFEIKDLLSHMGLLNVRNPPIRRMKSRVHGEDQWVLLYEDMRRISIDQIGIRRMLNANGDGINTNALPEARELNSQSGVDSRPNRAIQHQYCSNGEGWYCNDETIMRDYIDEDLSTLLETQAFISKRKVDDDDDYDDDASRRNKTWRGFRG
jgi:hypothetical protein